MARSPQKPHLCNLERKKTIVIQNKKYYGKLAKKKLRKVVAKLYKAKAKTNLSYFDRKAIQTKIDQKIRAWNNDHSPPFYYNLHWMSRYGALLYAIEMVKKAKKRGVKKVRFETGRGNHSWNRFPAIKDALLKHFRSSEGLSVEVDPKNDGVLVIDIH